MQGKLGDFDIIKTIGTGASCKVKLGIDAKTGKKVAIKIMNPNLSEKDKNLLKNELGAMSQLKHKNIVNVEQFGNETYFKNSGKTKQADFIVLELASGGELFDFISSSGRFEEPLARYYMKQFLDGLNYCHDNKICHRDLKPENLLLDGQFTLKIADFGFAAPIMGRDGSGYLETKLGTLNYMAPEIHLKQPYEGKSVDIFAAGIILFIMVAQHPPFTTATPQDPFYRCLAANRADIFWRTHCKNKEQGDEFFSQEFQHLIQSMLQLDPAQRPTILEIMNHPWMKGPTPTEEQVYQEFEKRQ